MVILPLVSRDACGSDDIFGFLSDAVEERADLLAFFGGNESGCDAKVLEAASPTGRGQLSGFLKLNGSEGQN